VTASRINNATQTSKLITGRAMNDEKRFSASTPTVPESADGTPPERQIRLPLTPPATDELPSTPNPQSPVSAVLDLIKQRRRYICTDQSRELKVRPSEYRNLLVRLEQLPELQKFVNDKLRYATIKTTSITEVNLTKIVFRAPPMITIIKGSQRNSTTF
jgi:hypothetical protein